MNIEEKAYNPKSVEENILNFWQDNNLYSPEYKSNKNRKKTFSIILPPPNANSSLHLGTMSGNTIQDILGRYHRMIGDKVLLIPGKDHAAIQTEVVFEKILEKKGIKKRDLTREDFYTQCYEFCMQNRKIAKTQELNIGLSADYSRERFTLDNDITNMVYDTFIRMFNEGYIYRGKRIINWCIKDQTALADIDTEYREEEGKLYYIKYGDLTVATTRPETKMADVALAVNPKDKRYKHLIGKSIQIVSIEGERSLPIIGDRGVDPEFGTGVLKVTPGHSKEDFKIGENNNLPIISVIDTRGRITYGKYKDLKIKEGREKIVEDLQKLGLIEKIEDIKHNIQICERCKQEIEPLISYQWFIRTKDFAKEAIKASENNEIHFYPKRQENNYMRFLENIEDWCISRQQWWGQRIPAYYCGGKETIIDSKGDITEKILGCGEIIVSKDKPNECPKCGNKNIVQDEDIFDTWFSSTQWPYSVLGGVGSKDYKEFYPTNVMETGRDILFFWVARMVMMCIYTTGKVPFSKVYLHGLVLDKEGQKQSKSKGNGIDPKDMIDKYGTDALRLSLVSSISPDQDFRLYDEKVKGFRNFINKIYNSSRFIFLKIGDLTEDEKSKLKKLIASGNIHTKTNIKIHAEMHDHISNINRFMKNFEIGLAAFQIQNFYHHTFCDIYLEEMKAHNSIEAKADLINIFLQNILLMHPFIPFITENIYQILKEENLIDSSEDSIMYEKYPGIK
jgi:valyl-tRNA synthetase